MPSRKDRAKAVFAVWQAAEPEPRTELDFVNHYTLLVAVALSAQATDVSVNKATAPLFAKVQTPEAMVALGEEGLKTYIRTIGLFNSKAKNVIALSKTLIEKHGSQVPEDLAALTALPGVGVKTARVVLNCGFGHPYIAVDTHVFRVSNRIGLVQEKTPEKTQDALERNVPAEYKMHAHHWLILHGRYICKARAPLCEKCNVTGHCSYYAKERKKAEKKTA